MEGYGNENPGAFQPTRPLRGATMLKAAEAGTCGISTHAPLAGRDVEAFRVSGGQTYFNPRAPCGARHWLFSDKRRKEGISTHAPLAGRDDMMAANGNAICISTHAPLAGRDSIKMSKMLLNYTFQPTRPLRGATAIALGFAREEEISTHAPLAGRDCLSSD